MIGFYLNIEFYNTIEHSKFEDKLDTIGLESCEKITKQFQNAIKFLFELNDKASSTEDKYIVIMMWIVNAIGKIFPKTFNKPWVSFIEKESLILSFSRLLKFVKDNPDFKQNFFISALTHHFIIAARLSLSKERMTQISIHTICNCFDSTHQLKYFEQMTGVLVSAFLKYKSNIKIFNAFDKFISCFIKEEFYDMFKNTQFIFWEEISNSTLNVAKDILKIKRYLNETFDKTKQMLILLADKMMNCKTEHLLLLNFKYFLEILHSTDTDEKNALNDPETRSEVFSKVMWVKDKIASSTQNENDKSELIDRKELLKCYTDFISSISIGDSISNESWVRTSNIDDSDSDDSDSDSDDSDSDDSKSSNLEDVWIDGLWVLDKDYIKLNRKDSVEFCINVYKLLKNLVVSTDRPLNNILFSIWQLEWLIIKNRSARKYGLELQVKQNAAKIMSKNICKLTTFEDTNTRFDEWQSTISFCSYLINWIDNKNFKQVFMALYPLVQANDFVIIQQILPYFVYYAVRFNDDDSVVDKISEDICNFLKNDNYHQKLAVFSIFDFMNICLVQDKASVKQYSLLKNIPFNENLFQLMFKKEKDISENDGIMKLVKKLSESVVIGCSLRTIIKIMGLFDKIPLDLLSKAALSIKEYKRAALFFEEHVRKGVNANSANGQKTRFIEDSFEVKEVWSLAETYSKVLPNDFNLKEFKYLIEADIMRDSKSSEFVISKLKRKESSVNQKETSEANQKLLDLIDVNNNKFICSSIQKLFEDYYEDSSSELNNFDVWIQIIEYFNDFDFINVDFSWLSINLECSKSFSYFENIWCLLIVWLAKSIYSEPSSKETFDKIISFIHNMIIFINHKLTDLIVNSHKKSNQFKLFLQVLYEIKLITIRYISSDTSSQNKIKIFDLNEKEFLLETLKKRSENIWVFENNYKYFWLVYSIRSYIFLLYGYFYEYWFWQLKKVSVLVQTNKANIEKLNFKHLEKLKDLIPDYEFEKAKYHRLIGEKCKAKDYLKENLVDIKEKFDRISKDEMWSKQILNKNLMHDIWCFLFEVMIEIDPSSSIIDSEFK